MTSLSTPPDPTATTQESEGENALAAHPMYTDYAHKENKYGLEDDFLPSRLSNANFPVKLHFMLSDMKADGMEHVVSWQPHGRCFRIHNQHMFVEKVLPMYFQINKYPSFQRQLNIYNFRRLTRGQDKGCYYHELFLRSKRFLAKDIPRLKLKKTGPRKPADPDSEPNFYLMPYLPESNDVTRHKGMPNINNATPPGFIMPPPQFMATMMTLNPTMQFQWWQQYNQQMMAQMAQASPPVVGDATDEPFQPSQVEEAPEQEDTTNQEAHDTNNTTETKESVTEGV